MRLTGIALSLLIFLSSAAFVKGADEGMMIPALYGGVITNKESFSDPTGKVSTIKDSGFMTGIYLQYIKPGAFQGNLFGYWAPDVNYSRVLGLHGNVDGYFLDWGSGSLVAGVDVENININMKAGSHIYGLDKFNMNTDVLFCMARAGVRLYTDQSSNFAVTVFPYAGATREYVSIDMTQHSPFGPPLPDTKISSSDKWNYLSWGTNVTVRVYHFIDLTAKYLGRAKSHEYMNSFTGQLNVYLTHTVALSYQYKYMDTSKNGYDAYHLFGAGYVF